MKIKTEIIVLILITLCTGVSGIIGNVASSAIPDSWRSYTWIAWLLFALSLIILIGLVVWQSTLQNREKHKQQTIDEYQELLDIANQIENHVNKILIENQQTLSPVFDNRPSRDNIKQGMMRLFQIQHSRPEFAKWISYLNGKENNFENAEIKKEIRSLRHNLIKLESILYTNFSQDNSPTIQTLESYTKKYIVTDILGNDDIGLREVKDITNKYLENLRQIAATIGRTNGKLKATKI